MKQKEKHLSVQCVFAIPKDPDYTEEDLKIVLNDSVKKFHGMSTHIPNLPEEFALALVNFDTEADASETIKIVWMTAQQESAYLSTLNKWIDFYNLEVVDVLAKGEFEEEIKIIDTKEIKTGKVTIKSFVQN